ncbi:histidine kinase [Grimontia sp. AD028]|uniref:Autolysin sensor kinase n=1 Tax=Grimontia indica TaxID=1056512 RepID=R1IAR1_9GAMM|nr:MULTISPECIES: histidine kinase [Grimontia]EOD77851.1 Autolysin sensor kinase [Grimontia indica]KKD57883.1 histidine kinase [Grimontia sp. AD028]
MNPTIAYLERTRVLVVIGICSVIAYITGFLFGGAFYYHLAISLGYGVTLNFLHVFLARNFPKWSNPKRTAIAVSVGSIIGTMNMQLWIYQYRGFWRTEVLLPTLIFTVSVAIFTACFFIMRDRAREAENDLKDSQLRQAEQEKALINSQLKSLQGQMEPHFLFNTLANIQVLIDIDAPKAKLLLEKITDLLRASLKQQRKDTVSLNDELKLLDSYLSIQQIRLCDRMGFEIKVDPSISKQLRIPPFLIQPAVENAVVHGIEPSVKGGYIQINFLKEDDMLTVEISDNGIGFNDGSKGNGVSMKNVKERLSTLYGEKGRLKLIPHHGGGFTTRISFQCEQ